MLRPVTSQTAMSRALLLIPLPLLAVASCGVADSTIQAANNVTAKVSQFSIHDLRPNRIKVVDVREKDLKEMPLGDERLVAYKIEQEKARANRNWLFAGSVKFKEPDLPSRVDDMSAGLLPPKPN